MAFAALLGTIPWLAWLMLVANVFWAVAYDTEYAMVDRDDDIKIGIRTSALTFGRFDVLAVMLCYAVTFGIYAWIGVALHWSAASSLRLAWWPPGLCGLPLHADTQSGPDALLPPPSGTTTGSVDSCLPGSRFNTPWPGFDESGAALVRAIVAVTLRRHRRHFATTADPARSERSVSVP